MSKKPPPRPDLAALSSGDRSGGLPVAPRRPAAKREPEPEPFRSVLDSPPEPEPEPEPAAPANVVGILSDPLCVGARRRLNAHMAKACSECERLGWGVFQIDREPGYEIERCDTCKAYADDDQAVAAAALLLVLLVSGEHHTLTDVQRELVRDAARCLGDDWYTAKNGGHRASA